ncbi:MAG: disulfide bond formation protein B [Pseudomonadota bacterium]
MVALTAPAGIDKTLHATAIAAAMAIVVGIALGFQYIGGYIPCALCIEQRTPYYIGVPVMLAAAASSALKAPVLMTRALFLAGGVLMIYGAGLAAYHAGVEWGWWEGPADCGAASSITTDASTLLADINATRPPACNEAALRVLGLSFAGWNVLASAALAALCLRGAFSRSVSTT